MQTLVAEILTAWRRAERLVESLEAGSPEQAAAQRACDHMRDAYHELTHSGAAHAVTIREARELIAKVDPETM